MATTSEFIEYVCSQIDEEYEPRYRKMFGDYMAYVHNRPVLLVCDNTVYVKQLDCMKNIMEAADKGFPYNGAKEHYIVDIDDRETLQLIVGKLEQVTPIPVKRNKKRKLESYIGS